MSTTPAPIVLVLVSALLVTCNVFWLYSSTTHSHRGLCGHDFEAWGSSSSSSSSNNSSSSSGSSSSSSSSSGSVPHRRDYQQVVGSGLLDVPFPIPIPNDTVLLGNDAEGEEGNTRYLTIGISSVWRKDDYLTRTIDSILRETTEHERNDILIFLLLADADSNLRSQRALTLGVRYSHEIQTGLLRVLQPPPILYPSIDFTAIRRTYNDSVARVQWRTKQVLDFAFLFWYVWMHHPSTYYLVLEDDVLSAKHFVTAIKDFVTLHRNHHWISLQLAGFLGIGQLVRCSDLDRLVSFLLLFYREHPVDVLINQWINLMAPEKPPKDRPTRRVPGLFQHIGVHSTLANKTQSLKDNTFSLVKRRFSHVNPTADVVTTIRQYKAYLAEHAYSSAPGMFWGIPKPGDTFDILFPEPLKISRVVILTGAAINKKTRDRLLYGSLEVSSTFVKMENPKRALCKGFSSVQDFKNGELDVRNLRKTFPKGIQCLRIAIGTKQKSWVAITEVAVFTEEDHAGESKSTLISATLEVHQSKDKVK
ncbi:alpha-1,6-mannosyl-glycoprotein 4-beta-N-acetylglucosaminyltransferase isoform X2 [Procambarus clarkii]|uniref:alpha-1,6-mannosyl-glycoprotein 4-beta-N-acetylglucosaminyltransferase isoform X2 n=1 Tax=Procambarus clarkii TaxID=6728 RepID=UPI001E67162B|nr:alpha-1,6-mannosyl-glycoprotein 4-beta-N-acetylglucosaminyltransferase-like isoform X2 [Procambarus clarkii]